MIILKLILVILCAILWRLGGKYHHNIRRIGVPVILALFLAWHFWLIALYPLLIFLTCGAGYGATISLGYGIPGPDDKGSWLGRIFKIGWLTRGVYGLICACLGSLALIVGGFISLPMYLGYLALNLAAGALLSYFKVPNPWIELLIGAVMGLIVFA